LENLNTAPQNAVKWYAENILTYMEFTGKVEFLTKEILINRKLKTYDVKARTKSLESIRSKLEEKGGIEEIKDIVGVRVIAYEKSDISKICDCIEEAFHVLDTKSYPEEAEDESQYKSKHFKCKLPDDRIILPEYSRFGGIIFEIQVRTLLQHAWAEIGHDKNY
jgi:ppGpp synthetase/RelA/SpoT-type nucleotidyltranferase